MCSIVAEYMSGKDIQNVDLKGLIELIEEALTHMFEEMKEYYMKIFDTIPKYCRPYIRYHTKGKEILVEIIEELRKYAIGVLQMHGCIGKPQQCSLFNLIFGTKPDPSGQREKVHKFLPQICLDICEFPAAIINDFIMGEERQISKRKFVIQEKHFRPFGPFLISSELNTANTHKEVYRVLEEISEEVLQKGKDVIKEFEGIVDSLTTEPDVPGLTNSYTFKNKRTTFLEEIQEYGRDKNELNYSHHLEYQRKWTEFLYAVNYFSRPILELIRY